MLTECGFAYVRAVRVRVRMGMWSFCVLAFFFYYVSVAQAEKISKKMFNAWVALLKEVPKSSFWIIASNAKAEANLRREVEAAGVGHRVFVQPRLPREQFLAIAPSVCDLVIDTYPVNSRTAAAEMLPRVLPFLTLRDESRCGRTTSS
eukprot:Opistho-1_new@2334